MTERPGGTRLLIDERPQVVLPSLAIALGLAEAIILQQIHYGLSSKSARERDGRRWVYNSYSRWTLNFPFLSQKQIRTAINNLEGRGILLSANYNPRAFDRTKWYTIDYDQLRELSDTLRPLEEDAWLAPDSEGPEEGLDLPGQPFALEGKPGGQPEQILSNPQYDVSEDESESKPSALQGKREGTASAPQGKPSAPEGPAFAPEGKPIP